MPSSELWDSTWGPGPKAPKSLIALAFLYRDDSPDIPDDERWIVAVQSPVDNGEDYDLDGSPTPGGAVDRAWKWAKDRGSVLCINTTTFEIRKL